MDAKLFQESVSKEAKKIISEAMNKSREVSIDEIKKLAETMGSLSSTMSLKNPEIHVFEEKSSVLNENMLSSDEIKKGDKHYRSKLINGEVYSGFWDQSDNGYSNVYKISEKSVPSSLKGEELYNFIADNGEIVNDGWNIIEGNKNSIKEKRTPDVDVMNENKDLYHKDTKEKSRYQQLIQYKKYNEDAE